MFAQTLSERTLIKRRVLGYCLGGRHTLISSMYFWHTCLTSVQLNHMPKPNRLQHVSNCWILWESCIISGFSQSDYC